MRRKTKPVESPKTVPLILSAALLKRSPAAAAELLGVALDRAEGSLDGAAADLQVSRSSVQRWVKQLRAKGFTFKVRGRGEKVTPQKKAPPAKRKTARKAA